MTRAEKLTIAQGICAPLLRKIRADLQRNADLEEDEGEEDQTVNRLDPRYSSGVLSPGRHVRTRLYFTSESHIHSLLTILSEGGLVDSNDEQWQRAMEYVSLVSELNYMTQVVIMLYEDPTKEVSSDERFHVELHFSPGVNCCVHKELPPGPGFRPHSRSKGSHSYADFDIEPSLATPPPPLVCSIKCSKDSFANVFERPSYCGAEFSFDDTMEMDEDGKSSINTAVSEPIEIKVTSTSMDDLDGSKVNFTIKGTSKPTAFISVFCT